jgi:hypothetical protein
LADQRQRKKELKREARRLRREREAVEWEEHMVLQPGQLKDLLEFLDEQLGVEACDHSLRFTMRWAEAAGVDQDALEESVHHFGGGCDCEVLANVDPQTRVDTWPRYMEFVASDD